jgi:Zn-dependent peptidase ImmA (M78 family)
MDENTAISRARQLLARYHVKYFPVDVLGIAQGEGFDVRESGKLSDDEAGQTFIKAGQRYIVVNKNNHPFRRRFTILHEMAHHALGLPSVHGETVPSDELERFRSRPPEEVLCDVFAAECLVPWQLIQPMTEEFDFSIGTIQTLSERFEASKLCVASRFARASALHLAYVVAEEGSIKYAVPSSALREARVFLRKGVALPERSAAAQAIQLGNDQAVADMEASEWSHSDAADRFSVHEEAIYHATWEQSLSLLTFEEDVQAPRAISDRAAEDDELLPELTGYLSWDKKKR